MNPVRWLSLRALIGILLLAHTSLLSQQHYATRLGNPETRFADPLRTSEDLRRLFASPALRDDVDFIARESGFAGDLEDLRRAAAKEKILELAIPTGTLLPAMSTRKNGRAVLLREVLWKGAEAIPAFEFYFTSQGRRYRVVTPKPCSNFWVEDYGKVRLPVLDLQCHAPAEVPLRRPVEVCLAVTNSGDELEARTTLTLAVPGAAGFVSATAGGRLVGGQVIWDIPVLMPEGVTNVCAVFTGADPVSMSFVGAARGAVAPAVQTRCETRVVGVPGVLLEVVDIDDPIEVGSHETYELLVLNQGSVTLTNLRFVCTLEDSQEFVSATGASAATAEGRSVRLAALPELKPKERAIWRVMVKVLKASDARFQAEMTADQFQRPIRETESTHQY